MTEPKLKPCPFCGSYMVRIAKDKLRDGGYIYDVCPICPVWKKCDGVSKDAFELWLKQPHT